MPRLLPSTNIVIIGSVKAGKFQRASLIAKKLEASKSRNYDIKITPLTPIEYIEKLDEMKQEVKNLVPGLFPGLIVRLTESGITVNLSGAEFVEWAINTHNIEDITGQDLGGIFDDQVATELEKIGNEAFNQHIQAFKHTVINIEIQVGNKISGILCFELFNDIVPLSVEHFVSFVTGTYKDPSTDESLTFKNSQVTRVIKEGWFQAGAIRSPNGTPIVNNFLADENFIIPHAHRGNISFVNFGPHSNFSQFMVTLRPMPYFDRKFVCIGRCLDGEDILQAIDNVKTRFEKPVANIRIVDATVVYEDTLVLLPMACQPMSNATAGRSILKRSPTSPTPPPSIGSSGYDSDFGYNSDYIYTVSNGSYQRTQKPYTKKGVRFSDELLCQKTQNEEDLNSERAYSQWAVRKNHAPDSNIVNNNNNTLVMKNTSNKPFNNILPPQEDQEPESGAESDDEDDCYQSKRNRKIMSTPSYSVQCRDQNIDNPIVSSVTDNTKPVPPAIYLYTSSFESRVLVNNVHKLLSILFASNTARTRQSKQSSSSKPSDSPDVSTQLKDLEISVMEIPAMPMFDMASEIACQIAWNDRRTKLKSDNFAASSSAATSVDNCGIRDEQQASKVPQKSLLSRIFSSQNAAKESSVVGSKAKDSLETPLDLVPDPISSPASSSSSILTLTDPDENLQQDPVRQLLEEKNSVSFPYCKSFLMGPPPSAMLGTALPYNRFVDQKLKLAIPTTDLPNILSNSPTTHMNYSKMQVLQGFHATLPSASPLPLQITNLNMSNDDESTLYSGSPTTPESSFPKDKLISSSESISPSLSTKISSWIKTTTTEASTSLISWVICKTIKTATSSVSLVIAVTDYASIATDCVIGEKDTLISTRNNVLARAKDTCGWVLSGERTQQVIRKARTSMPIILDHMLSRAAGVDRVLEYGVAPAKQLQQQSNNRNVEVGHEFIGAKSVNLKGFYVVSSAKIRVVEDVRENNQVNNYFAQIWYPAQCARDAKTKLDDTELKTRIANVCFKNPLSFSFSSGAGPLDALYSVGVAEGLLKQFRPELFESSEGFKWLGCGFGSIVAAVMALNLGKPGLVRAQELFQRLHENGSKSLFGNCGKMSHTLKQGLFQIIPYDVSAIDGRLFISSTLYPSMKNTILVKFPSKFELIDAIMASCFIPVLYENPVYLTNRMTESGVASYACAGALTNHLPILNEYTITVSPVPATANISPWCENASELNFRTGAAVFADGPLYDDETVGFLGSSLDDLTAAEEMEQGQNVSVASKNGDVLQRERMLGMRDGCLWAEAMFQSGHMTHMAFSAML
ncbi:putative inactive peptidyl-prolyl cis-trans isomerase-like 6 [Physocladia obscura]|uniref:Inactive peptidyl-prolyl cis-trans isomerase-like 6 n=1 Tax=Physocladia obscura TaxID=109957 RepID=A0AAD5T891_9FUNG|nr:putative inactive peptidyl-prolyl cis-trans isomerase-like 6 [Physocladia obscura]